MKPKVKFTNVSKKYSLFRKKSDVLLDVFSLNKKQKSFYALKNISFEVFEGETIGVIGVNGSGKSTLSNLLAGIIPPTTGSVEINGETSLVAISAGLNNSLSGLENIRLKCLMHGLNKKEIEEITPVIIDFADIGEFIHQPIKSYSSGMKSRLGFAISVHINPDVLIVDEALSVGDQTFYEKCIGKFNEFKRQGKTIFFISHSLSQIRSISDRVIWMNFGEIKEFDDKEIVLSNYQKFIQWFSNLNETEKKEHRTKMLKEQMRKSSSLADTMSINRSESRRSIDNDKKKKKKKLLGLQMGLLTGIFLLSASLLFVNRPLAFFPNILSMYKNDSTEKDVLKGTKPGIIAEKIEKRGLIKIEGSSIYEDKELTRKIVDLPFATEVFIDERFEGAYKVQYEERKGYINSEHVNIINEPFEKVNLTINSMVPIFPQGFANSYQYALAHLNFDYQDIKEKFGGLSAEEEDQFGNKLLSYNGEHMTFQFDNSGVANTLIITDIIVDDPKFSQISNSAQMQTPSNNLFYLLTEHYKIVINKDEKIMTLTSLES
jgi:teichoic acid transport system ATP-binding protein